MAKREFVIRGITPSKLEQNPNARGTIENLDGFKEAKAGDLSGALVEIFTDQTFRKMLPTQTLLDRKDVVVSSILSGTKPLPVIVLKVKLGSKGAPVSGGPDLRQDVWNSLLRWAEKSRVKGVRGWRISAVRPPRWEDGVASTEVVIGGAVFYNNKRVTVGLDDNYVAETMDDLTSHLSKIGISASLNWKK